MSYNPAIPQITDPLLQSQAQLRANFQSIFTVWGDNHYSLTGNNTFQGMHNVLTMQPQSGDPTTDATHIALYNKLDSNMIPELFFRPNANQTPIQLTYPSIAVGINGATPPVYLTSQYTFSAGPFVIYGGLINNPTNGQTVILTPTTTLLYVGLTVANFLGSPLVIKNAIPTNITGSSFNISYATNIIPGTLFNVYYLAIGK
jgi:hypothetical protein